MKPSSSSTTCINQPWKLVVVCPLSLQIKKDAYGPVSGKSGHQRHWGLRMSISGAASVVSHRSYCSSPGFLKDSWMLRDGYWSIATMLRVPGLMTYMLNAHETPLWHKILLRQSSWRLLSQLQRKGMHLQYDCLNRHG